VMPGNGTVWETWMAHLTNNNPAWEAANGAKFNLNTNALREEGMTSGDAAGLSMFPALVRYDECERGVIEHALRLIVAHTREEFIYPATHKASNPSTTDVDTPAMGQRFRLKSNFSVPDGWTKQEKAVCAALKKYGAIVADNGGFFSFSVCPDNRFPDGCFDNLSSIDIDQFVVIETTGPDAGPRSPNAPTVNAGADQTIAPGATATLSATTTGSGLTLEWYVYPFKTAPGTVTFNSSSSASTTATFSADGKYTLMIRASDGVHTPAFDAVVVTVGDGGGNDGGGDGGSGGGKAGTGDNDDFDGDGIINSADDDDDNDGTSDADELAAGTDPFDFFDGGSSSAFTVSALKGKVNFGKDGADGLSLKGVLPGLPALLNVDQRAFAVSVGGMNVTFTLDAKGRGKNENGNVSLKLKPSKRNKATKVLEFLGGDVAFQCRLSKGTWSDDWADEGVDPALDTKGTDVEFGIDVALGGKPYDTTVTSLYKGKAEKGGSFSYKGPSARRR
jgi:hypothetical protein